MRFEILLLIIQCIMYFTRNDQVIANPLFGVNIRDARPNEFPFAVSFMRLQNDEYNIAEGHVCTGSLITRNHVLTAAHCLEDEIMSNMAILVGTNDLRCGTKYDILWWITYNEWCLYEEIRIVFRVNDIAVLKLTREVDQQVQLGVLSPVENSVLYNKHVQIAGWGHNEENIIPVKMRTVVLKVYTMRKCNEVITTRHGSDIKIHNRHICTYAVPYAIAHYGDSGAPIVFEGMIVAIHKSTVPFPGDLFNIYKINVHTRINYYRQFIDSTSNANFQWHSRH